MEATHRTIPLPFHPGDRCGEWCIVRHLGHGGAGTVYEAEHPWTGARVAIKALHRDHRDYAKRMELEAKTLAEIQHPHVVRVFAGGVTDDGIVWFAMELLVGQPLSHLLHRERLQAARALRFAAQIAEGVHAAHVVGVIHRDLKPENIFIVEPQDEVRVLDFGTAKFRRGCMKTTDRFRVIGTYAYMSPERLVGGDSSVATDVYSFGLIVYEMLAGKHCWALSSGPYDLPDVEALGLLQIQGKPESLRKYCPDVSRDLDRYVRARLLHKKPRSRPQSMLEVAKALRSLAQGCEPEQPPRARISGFVRAASTARAGATIAQRGVDQVTTHPVAPTEQRLLVSASVLATHEISFALAITEEGKPPTLDLATQNSPRTAVLGSDQAAIAEAGAIAEARTHTAPTRAHDTLPGGADSIAASVTLLRERLNPPPTCAFSLRGLTLLGALGFVAEPSSAVDELREDLEALLACHAQLPRLDTVVQLALASVALTPLYADYVRALLRVFARAELTLPLLPEWRWTECCLPHLAPAEQRERRHEAVWAQAEGRNIPWFEELVPPANVRTLALSAMLDHVATFCSRNSLRGDGPFLGGALHGLSRLLDELPGCRTHQRVDERYLDLVLHGSETLMQATSMTLAAWTRLPNPEPARSLLVELAETDDHERLSQLTALVSRAILPAPAQHARRGLSSEASVTRGRPHTKDSWVGSVLFVAVVLVLVVAGWYLGVWIAERAWVLGSTGRIDLTPSELQTACPRRLS